MSLIAYLILLAVQGLIVGALARLALPGRDPLSIPRTMLVGIAGSFVGGLLVYAISGGRSAGGFFAAFACSVGIVYLIRRSRGGGVLAPDAEAAEHRRRRGY
ncbi:MAG: GlsB/YeaQ/YmgE family stress response membrane protein [Solirubrobacteraceae bacterium]